MECETPVDSTIYDHHLIIAHYIQLRLEVCNPSKTQKGLCMGQLDPRV